MMRDATSPPQPGFVVGLAAALHAAIFGAAAAVLPWQGASSFGLSAGAMALAFAAVTVTTWTRRPSAAAVWRGVSVFALLFVGVWAYFAASAGVYLARLYGGLGEGLALAAVAAFCPVVLFTVPFAAWGLSATRGASPRRGLGAGAAMALLVAGVGSIEACASATPSASELPEAAEAAPHAALERGLQGLFEDRPGFDGRGAGLRLFTAAPASCAAPLDDTEAVTVFVTHLRPELTRGRGARAGAGTGPTATITCLQVDPETLWPQLAAYLDREVAAGPVQLDFVRAHARLDADHPLVDGLKLRPGLDGACVEGRCLTPWQLVATDQFTKFVPIDFIADLRVGFDRVALAEALELEGPEPLATDAILRFDTFSYWVDRSGEPHALYRGRAPEPVVDAERTRAAVVAAQDYILSAQEKDGRFRYKYDPYTGESDRRNYNMPRQAGTTLALCEVGAYEGRVDRVVAQSLKFMAVRGRDAGEGRAFLTKSRKAKKASLGSTALPLIAFARCRERVGPRHDALMGKMARGLLALQRDDGGFFPSWDRRAAQAVDGPEPLFAEGQVIFALTELERIQIEQGPIEGWPTQAQLHEAVERAMDHYAEDYWDHALAQFFWIEENWHCLAARASLGHHRHDGYERFCLDYVRYKQRLSLDADSRVAREFEGGYGFGNVIPPHNTGTAGYGEAISAAIAIARARGERTQWMEEDLLAAHRFLLRQQWGPDNDFMARRDPPVRGAFSESMSSPVIRIDFVQHAMAALGHGARVLYEEPRDVD